MAKKKAKSTKQDDDVVYDDTDDDDDDWVEDEKAATESDKGKGKGKDKDKPAEEKPVESVAQMPENKPGEAPPDPKEQEPVVANYDLGINPQPEPAKEE